MPLEPARRSDTGGGGGGGGGGKYGRAVVASGTSERGTNEFGIGL